MSDIARRAGVSRVAVSYALNDRPGVSAELRERIVRIAEEVGFSANLSARALHGAATHAIGLVLRRPVPGSTVDVFRRELISGIQIELAGQGFGLALRFVDGFDEEVAVYRQWDAERRLDGVVVCDLDVEDPRPAALAQLDLPAVVLGEAVSSSSAAHLWTDHTGPATAIVDHLEALGHGRIAYLTGPTTKQQTTRRTAALTAACRDAGITLSVVATDRSGEAGAQASRRTLSSPRRPTAIVFDNDVMAVAGLGVATEMGLVVPVDLSIAGWEDSSLCQAVRPAVTVLRRDIAGDGGQAVRVLFEMIAGQPPRDIRQSDAVLVPRASTGPAAAQRPES